MNFQKFCFIGYYNNNNYNNCKKFFSIISRLSWSIIHSKIQSCNKRPEELVYLFLIIAVGIGIGAGQVQITIFGIILALIILSAYHYISKKKIFLNTDKEQLNLGISINESLRDNQIDDILNLVKDNCSFIKFVSLSRTSDHTTINLDINLKDQTNLSKLSGQLNDKYKNTKVIISSNYDLAV